eukprot:14830884-Alexandrium_andersonii.AAC.1
MCIRDSPTSGSTPRSASTIPSRSSCSWRVAMRRPCSAPSPWWASASAWEERGAASTSRRSGG